MSQFGTLNINGKEYDLDDVELDDMAEVESLNQRKVMRDGAVFEEPTPFADLNFGSTGVMKAMAYVILRRENPEITFEQVGKMRLVSFTEADEELPDTGPPDGDGTTIPDTSGPAASGAPDSDTQSLDSSPGTSES